MVSRKPKVVPASSTRKGALRRPSKTTWRTPEALEHCPIPVFLLHRDTLEILQVNGAVGRVYRCAREDLLGVSFAGLADEHFPLEEGVTREVRHRRGDERGMLLEITPWAFRFGNKSCWLVFAVDVTEKHELENRLFQMQRLECIGALSSGMAHDLNNILAPIMMAAAMLHEELPEVSRKEFLATIEQSAQRGVNLLKAVLTFSRGVEGNRVPVEPGTVVQEICEMIRQTFPKAIHVRATVAPDLWQIVVEETKFHQVLLNLVINARDAMPKGGRLAIEAANRELDAGAAALFPDGKPGRYVAISVMDTGCGMSAAMLEDIFTPFFTTKEPGKGTGLGLSTVQGIVKGYGGWMAVASEPEQGSVFTAYLPAVSEAVTRQATGGEGELVLVVDDEPGICRMIRTILTRRGYRVVLAHDGMEAMAEYIRNPASFSLILADLSMPVMDGVVLTRAIKRVDPKAKVIAMSGFDSETRLQELASLGVTRFLRKPYQAGELVAMVAETIAE